MPPMMATQHHFDNTNPMEHDIYLQVTKVKVSKLTM